MKLSIIGNGKLSKNYGSRIDKSDVIVRFNHIKIKGYEKTHGKNTHILGLAGATSLSYEGEASKLDIDILKDIGWIMFSGRKRNEDYEELLLKKKSILNDNQANIVFNYIDYTCYNTVLNILKINGMHKIPSTGINILCYLLFSNNYPSKQNKFNIYGFDCFESGHYWENHKRKDAEYHDLKTEKAVINYFKQFKNIKFFN